MGLHSGDVVTIGKYLATLVATYFALKQATPNASRKQRSWYLTTVASVVTCALGLYFAGRIVVNGLSAELGRDEASLDRFAAHFFVAYCCADLLTGRIEYRELLDWQTGWTHHTFYAAALLILLARGQTNLFAAGLIEEVPTIVLCVSRLQEKRELRWPFAVLFFVLRIVYHTVATFEALAYSTLAFALGLVVLRTHLWWFGGWWRGATEDAHHAGPQEGRGKKAAVEKQLTLNQKLMMLGSMMLCQIATMLHATRAGYQRREWANATLSGLVLVAAWLYFSFQSVAIFVDTYTVGFIALAISERKVIYNISWEDPRVEREALNLGANDVVLTISSAGCNVMDYLIERPKHVTAVDLNEAQLAVLDLKLACVATAVPHAEFFALWGASK